MLKFLKKYLSIVFLLSVLLLTLHHHNDLQEHYDCPIYVLHINLSHANVDIQQSVSVEKIFFEIPVIQKITFLKNYISSSFFARAPPYIV